MSNYVVLAFANLHKSDIIGDIALNYLADVASKYKLNEYGDVLNMDKYRINSKTLRQKQLWAFKHFALNQEAKEEALNRKKESENDGNTIKSLRKLHISSKKVTNLFSKGEFETYVDWCSQFGASGFHNSFSATSRVILQEDQSPM